MIKPLCSVVMASYQRRHLLERSLVCYEKQEFDNSRFELIVIDDHSTDGTRELVLDWSKTTKISATVLTVSPKPSKWIDCAWILNSGIRISTGRNVLVTHPEIMPGHTSVSDCVNQLEAFENKRVLQGPAEMRSPIGLYACCRSYYLSPYDQTNIDTVDWRDKGILAVRDIDKFYENDIGGHPDFSHRATDMVAQPGSRIPHWQSWIFGGHSRRTWKELGGMLPTTKWGSCDVGWMHRRQVLGIANYTCPSESSIVVHQNHNLPGDVETPRIEQDWKDELSKVDMRNPNNLIYPTIDEIRWS